MPFSKSSKAQLATCRKELRDLFIRVDELGFECTIIEGHRPQWKQDKYFEEGKSRVRYPDGAHNRLPSCAVDAAPYLNGGVSWDTRHCLYFAGAVIGIAAGMGIGIRWGGDWDMDHEPMTDQEFQDLVHFELRGD